MNAKVQTLQVYDQYELPSKANSSVVKPDVQESELYWRPLIILSSALIFCGLMFSGYTQAMKWLDRPVNEIRMLGETKYLNKTLLAEKLAASISAPLLHLDIEALRNTLLDDPWVQAAEVRREWPPAVSVLVSEQIPVARWGKKGLLNHQGDIFWPDSRDGYEHLPELNGPATETQLLMAQYHDMSRLFQGASVRMSGLTMEARGAWILQMGNGIEVVVGREQLKDRLQRFLHVYQKELASAADRIERIDIRYTNGVAVKWREPIEQIKAG
ncbi:cell division protein FtsQ/DivIB [Neptunomonas concharum]|uniref:Cell division protein FtsQ n=1 Tax=Neptunomonas concharum TaxID=1031538 RepID=A0A5P1R8T0_9GAMM|nr:cell division protein FtsQ/DivIB [Neptunomonas concharum]QEQ96030.1 FtsQ-type POTRA domain-containing protein [Neptunomonas concharum]